MSDTPDTSSSKDPEAGNPESSGPPVRRRRGQSAIIPLGNYNECGDCSAMVLEQFAKSFDKSAKRWELIVYPSLFAFIILAMYGFFLIYSLTQDIRTMATSIDPKMGANMGSLSANIRTLSDNVELMSTHLEYISDNMETMSVDMQTMAESVEHMTDSVHAMNKDVSDMNKNVMLMAKIMEDMGTKLNSLGPITTNMTAMNQAMQTLTAYVSRMGYDMNSATRPMSFINRFMPW
ncbi:MAG: hypothetical protein HQL56_13590 [Magnetococcales bacterium]|nr:hypothetical protein [Magnetococcales bacterium]